MSTKGITVDRTPLRKVLQHIDEGRFAVPKLQREFVWDGPKAAKLLDSIYRGMPIGLVLIWETPRSQRLYLRQKYHVLPPFNARNGRVWFLVDGQQRISVLHRVREGGSLRNARGKEVDFGRVVFSLDKEDDGLQIRYRKPVPGSLVPMAQVLHPQWRHKLGPLGKRQKARVQECRRRVLGYGTCFMFVKMHVDDIRECFLRINTQGMKVTTADAIFTQAKDLDLRDIVHEVREHLDESFSDLPEMPVLWALAATRGGADARGQALRQVIGRLQREAENDRRSRKGLAKDWSRLARCFGKAADYLREHFKVLNRGFLYSDYMLAMMALFYYWNGKGPNVSQRERIRKWFWATAVGSRYSGRNFLRNVPEDARFFKSLAQKRHAQLRGLSLIDKSDIRRTQYASHTGIGSAFYSPLLLRRPVSILDDGLNDIPVEKFSTPANRKDRHHVFAQAALANVGIPANRYNSICNICLLTAEENQMIGYRHPRSYLGEVAERPGLFKRKMSRHLIPVGEDSGVWHRDLARGFNRFLKDREVMICHALEEEAGIRLFRREKA